MGWTSTVTNRAGIISRLCKNEENEFARWELLAKKLSGNNLWTVWEYTKNKPER